MLSYHIPSNSLCGSVVNKMATMNLVYEYIIVVLTSQNKKARAIYLCVMKILLFSPTRLTLADSLNTNAFRRCYQPNTIYLDVIRVFYCWPDATNIGELIYDHESFCLFRRCSQLNPVSLL